MPAPLHRPMTVVDLDAVMAIEVRAYSHPWTRGNFIDSLAAGYDTDLRLDAEGRLIGYSVAMPGVEESHLLNLAVSPEHRRQGHAGALLRRVVTAARARGDALLWLEVRASNAGGRALYAGAGFVEVGVRPNYYPLDHQRREDAVLMRLDLQAGDRRAAGGRGALD